MRACRRSRRSPLPCAARGARRRSAATSVADRAAWRAYDTTALLEDHGWEGPPILVDQGTQDQFLETQLKPELLRTACADAGAGLELRLREGYDHSYYFIATFVADHLRYHAQNLAKAPGGGGRES